MKNPNVRLGIIFLTIGLGMAVALNPWWAGMAFILIGAHRLFVGLQAKDSAAE